MQDTEAPFWLAFGTQTDAHMASQAVCFPTALSFPRKSLCCKAPVCPGLEAGAKNQEGPHGWKWHIWAKRYSQVTLALPLPR